MTNALVLVGLASLLRTVLFVESPRNGRRSPSAVQSRIDEGNSVIGETLPAPGQTCRTAGAPTGRAASSQQQSEAGPVMQQTSPLQHRCDIALAAISPATEVRIEGARIPYVRPVNPADATAALTNATTIVRNTGVRRIGRILLIISDYDPKTKTESRRRTIRRPHSTT